MRKILKIILVVFLAIVIFGVVGLSVVFLDVASYTATKSKELIPSGSTFGKALVLYDPGLTGAPEKIANDVARDFHVRGYIVTLAGIKNGLAATDISQYQVIVVGGPVYGAKAASSVQTYLSNLKPTQNTKIGVFRVGSFNTPNDKVAPLPKGSTLTIKETLKISTSQDAITESAQFVTQLLS